MEPHTQRFTTGRFLEIDQLAGLPYAPEAPITAENFDKPTASEMANGVLRFQQAHRCDHYLSAALPYYDRDFQRWASFNDWLLDEACTANGSTDIDRRPLIAQVAPGRTALLNPQIVVNRLLDYPIAGAYVQPLLLNPVKDSAEKLKLYVEFLLAIADEGIPVIAARVGAFGLVLQALGIAAFDSGLGQAEASNLAQLNRVQTEKEKERRQEGKGGGPDSRVYFERLKTTLKGSHANAVLDQRGLRSNFVCVFMPAANTEASRIFKSDVGSTSCACEMQRFQPYEPVPRPAFAEILCASNYGMLRKPLASSEGH